MIALFALLAAAAAPAAAPAATSTPAYDAVSKPTWLSIPSKSMMLNCTNGYLTDPTFTGESILMVCLVRPDGGLSDCKVRETKRAEAAGVQDVAVCAAAGFRFGPVDKLGKPTAGRPIILPLAIVGGAGGASTPAQSAAPKQP